MADDRGVRSSAAMHSVLTPLTLRFYDFYVLGFSSRLLWRCPAPVLLDLYHRNVSDSHLEVGVGTGYLLDNARFSSEAPAITLMDINAHCLASAAHRIARYGPQTVVADILDPLPQIGPFTSIGCCHVLHCLPGSMAGKARVFDHLAAVLATDGCLFGASVVQGDAPRSPPAQALMNFYNARSIFSNAQDRVEMLEEALTARFHHAAVSLRGCVALFEASGPRSRPNLPTPTATS